MYCICSRKMIKNENNNIDYNPTIPYPIFDDSTPSAGCHVAHSQVGGCYLECDHVYRLPFSPFWICCSPDSLPSSVPFFETSSALVLQADGHSDLEVNEGAE